MTPTARAAATIAVIVRLIVNLVCRRGCSWLPVSRARDFFEIRAPLRLLVAVAGWSVA